MPLSSFVTDYVSSLSGGDSALVTEIHPGDEMFSYGLHSLRGNRDAAGILYFSTGRLIADAILAALTWRFDRVRSVALLDFASGFGRATRFLTRALDPAAITVAEIDPEALAFQRRAFGVHAVPSSSTADAFQPGRTFDAIVAASFFSHLPERTFEPWLARFWSLLEPGGLLCFSTHGPSLLAERVDWSRGIVFRAQSETDRLDREEYGTSFVRPEFVAAASDQATQGRGSLRTIPFGLGGHQDLYLLSRGPNVPAAQPAIPVIPRGDLERFEIRGRVLFSEGVVEADGNPTVVFLVRDEVRGESRAKEDQSGRRRWAFEIAYTEDISPDDVLRIEARSLLTARVIAMGTLGPYL